MPECPKHGHELELAFVHDGYGYWDCPSCQPLYKIKEKPLDNPLARSDDMTGGYP